ncbi:MAG: Ribosomal RNA small subunit methyltransferase D [candidate division TA06 bacterium ADurb.Bin417]|uniref:Ribosomal RNA small subunit methyltransferase D n=1 Tax=candidate division TA06 bacterium ADurb.Bin417 TaxID=1852828 RepID=A0A1V5MIZ0_UNCT6|nr:MAG: Ribosomal RNA small subunit methyltransferase D [candidate division TA06 bacterium ADurb.Bin417]
MYILAGRFKGRRLSVPANRILRPTTGLLRKALFDLLAPKLDGTAFLDLYAGVGSVGLEALSRGAGRITLVEGNPRVGECLRENIRILLEASHRDGGEPIAPDRVDFWPRPVEKSLARLAEAGYRYRFIFADPPYRTDPKEFGALFLSIKNLPLLEEGGLFILQHDRHLLKDPRFQKTLATEAAPPESRHYGASTLTLFYA